MMQMFLEWWSDRLKGRAILIDDKPYMERYFIGDINLRFFKWRFRRSFYLQCLLSSDTDAGFHNHPWPGFSIILSGFYKELYLNHRLHPRVLHDGERYSVIAGRARILARKVGLFNRLGVDKFHRIVLDETTSARVWTLFVRGPATHYGWGFMYPLHSSFDGNRIEITGLRWRQFAGPDNDNPAERQLSPAKVIKQYRTGCPF